MKWKSQGHVAVRRALSDSRVGHTAKAHSQGAMGKWDFLIFICKVNIKHAMA